MDTLGLALWRGEGRKGKKALQTQGTKGRRLPPMNSTVGYLTIGAEHIATLGYKVREMFSNKAEQ